MTGPFSAEVEGSVVGSMLANPRIVGEVAGTLLQPDHFHLPAFRKLYSEVLGAYYADEAIDPLTIAELCAKPLSQFWRCDESEAVAKVKTLASAANGGHEAVSHARLVKRDHDYRELLHLANTLVSDVDQEQSAPEELASVVAQRATQIATSTMSAAEVIDFEQLGRNYIRHQRELMAASRAGLDVGLKFGHQFIDRYTRGLRPSYVYILGGEPGVGKSGLAWCIARAYGDRQLERPEDKRIAALVLSLEMSEEVSSARVAQNLTGFDGGELQEGSISDEQLATLIKEWQPRRQMPLYFNFSSSVRASQMRALVADQVRKHNVGLVIIDHLRYFHMDDRRSYRMPSEEDEAKAEFIKEQIAKDLGVAVILLAHTTKGIDTTDDRRPRLSHLRGGGMVAAHADFVAFLYQPYMHASQKQIDEGNVKRTEAELIYAKNRHQITGTAYLHFDMSTMTVRDSWPT